MFRPWLNDSSGVPIEYTFFSSCQPICCRAKSSSSAACSGLGGGSPIKGRLQRRILPPGPLTMFWENCKGDGAGPVLLCVLVGDLRERMIPALPAQTLLDTAIPEVKTFRLIFDRWSLPIPNRWMGTVLPGATTLLSITASDPSIHRSAK